MRLYDLADQYRVLQEMMDGGDQETYQVMLDGIEDVFDNKVESIVKLMKAKIAEHDAVAAEAKRLSERATRLARDIDWLENYVETQMIAIGKEKVKSALFSISLVNNPPKVNILNESEIPSWYFNEKVSLILDKRTILEHLKDGEEIPGVEIKQDQRLSIR
jgi:hypothetical protein